MRKHLTYANVAATLALVIAVAGGTAYAASTIGTTDIINGQVKSADIGTGQVQAIDVGDGQLNDEDVGQGTFVDFTASIDPGRWRRLQGPLMDQRDQRTGRPPAVDPGLRQLQRLAHI